MLKLKLSFLFRHKRGDDVEFPSVFCEYVLLPLVNKETVSANDLAEQSQAEIWTEIERKSRQSQRDAIKPLKEKDARIFLVSHSIVIHRLIETG